MPKKLPSSSESDQSSDMPSPRKPKKGQPVLVSKLPVAVRSSPRKGSGPKTKPVQEFHKTLKKLVPKKVVQELPATRTSPRKTSQGQILVPKYVPKDLRQIVSKKVAQKRAPFSTNKEAAGSAGFESEESSGEEYNQQVSTPAGSTAPRFSPHITSKGSSTRTERPAEHHPVEDSDSELEEERAQQFVHQKRLLLEQRLSPSKRQVYEEAHHRPHFGQPSTSRDAEEAEGTARRLYVQLQTPGQAAGQEKSRRKTRPPVKRTRPYAQKALKEIRKYQRSTDLLIQKLPFSRVVRETLSRMRASQFRWQVKAIEALQESAECYLTALFEDAQLCAFHAGRVTVMVRDLQLSRRIYTRNGGF